MKNALLITSFLACSSTIAETNVVNISEHGFIVENVQTSPKSPQELWSQLTQDVDKWWPKDHTWWGKEGVLTIDTFAGGCFCEKSADKSAEHMRISFVEPHTLLRMTGGLGPLQGMGMYGALDWKLQPLENETKITLTYRVSGIDPKGFEQLAPIVAQVQGIQLKSLIEYQPR